jgi:hypothetical protein
MRLTVMYIVNRWLRGERIRFRITILHKSKLWSSFSLVPRRASPEAADIWLDGVLK